MCMSISVIRSFVVWTYFWDSAIHYYTYYHPHGMVCLSDIFGHDDFTVFLSLQLEDSKFGRFFPPFVSLFLFLFNSISIFYTDLIRMHVFKPIVES